jgi:hypothetical protein
MSLLGDMCGPISSLTTLLPQEPCSLVIVEFLETKRASTQVSTSTAQECAMRNARCPESSSNRRHLASPALSYQTGYDHVGGGRH